MGSQQQKKVFAGWQEKRKEVTCAKGGLRESTHLAGEGWTVL